MMFNKPLSKVGKCFLEVSSLFSDFIFNFYWLCINNFSFN